MGIKGGGHALLLVLLETCAVDVGLGTGLTGRDAPVSGRKRPSVKRLSSGAAWLAQLVEVS